MRLLMMHNTDPHYEAGAMPSLDLIESMGRLVEEMTKAGVMLAGVGLRPSSKGVRLSYSGGERRLRPIFLTTMAAAVGVTPMILSRSSMWSPLASVIAWHCTSS